MTTQLQVDVTGVVLAVLADGVDAGSDSRTPDKVETRMPFIAAARVGGPDDGMAIDIATVVLNCFAASDQAANSLSLTAVAALRAAVGLTTNNAVITQVRKLSGPQYADYENPKVHRTVTTVQVRAKAA